MAQERKRTVPVRKTKEGEPGAAAEAKQAPVGARKTAAKADATAAKGAKAAKRAAPKVAKKTTATAAKQAAAPKVAKKTTATAAKQAAAPKVTPARRATTSATATKRRSRTLQAVPEPTPEEIAFRAYLLWEQGVPGGETEHWLRAEAELRAA